MPTVGAGVGVEFRDRCSSLGGEWAIASPQSPDTPGLRVLIVEADSEVREEIRSIVDRHPDVGLAWGAETGGDAVRTAALTHPDIVLADLVKIFHPRLAPDHVFEWYMPVSAR